MEHIKRNISFGFGLSFLILLLSTAASYISLNNLVSNLDQVNHTNSVINELENIISTLKDAETGQRGYLLSGQEEFLEPYYGAGKRILSTFVRIKQLTKDDSVQLYNAARLESVIYERIIHLRTLIELKKTNRSFSIVELRAGKEKMDEARRMVKIMEDRARLDLAPHTERLKLFVAYTPIGIIVVAVVALLTTIIFYTRVRKDFEIRSRLQNELKKNEQHITRRIDIIHDIATKISAGDYKTRVNDEEHDALGGLADSLNKMADSLQYSFDLLREKEWMQTGVAELNEKMIDETDVNELSGKIIRFITNYINAQVGTIYILENEDELILTGAYAFVDDGSRKVVKLGEGLIGQCALSGEQKVLQEIEDTSIVINFAAGQIKPKNVIAIPIFYEKKLKGVVELATIHDIKKKNQSFLEAVAKDIGIGINSVQNRVKMQQLLREMQLQQQELHAQHADLQNVNAELEVNTSNLEASEGLLKIHQEELVESNRELEARTLLLEERNKIILDRNVEIQAQGEQLKLGSQYKSEFLTNMSHELRTPLNSILLLSGLMVSNRDNSVCEEHVEFAKVIQNSGKGLLALIDEILDLSKIESGKMELYYESVDIESIVQNMRGLFKEVALQKSIEFVINVAPETPVNIETDQMRLEQIIKNLLSNALKFTPENGRVELSVFKSFNETELGFAIKDTGIGIPEEKQLIIFEAFQQADGSTQRQYGGTGLGLSISRQLVTFLGGRIKLESEPGKGSEFTVFVPIVKPMDNSLSAQREMPLYDLETDDNEAGNGLEKTSNYSVNKPIADDRAELNPGDKSILIIEPNVILANTLLELTRGSGWKGIVSQKKDGGLVLSKKFKPSGVLFDLRVGEDNDWKFIAEIKNDIDTRHIPIYLLTSNNLQEKNTRKDSGSFTDKLTSFHRIKHIFENPNDVQIYKKKKILIVEENEKHAQTLAFHLKKANINTDFKYGILDGIESLLKEEVHCVIIYFELKSENSYQALEQVWKKTGLENLPILMFASQDFPGKQQYDIKKYLHSDSLEVNGHSYNQVLDGVSMFLRILSEDLPADSSETNLQFQDMGNLLQDKVILIVDDDIRNIFSMTKVLEQHKMHVLSALDGKEALILLKENTDVDIILMDMMMPVMDGYETTIQITRDPELSNIPVIALTAKADIGDREKCIEAGARDYIIKPVNIDKLLSLLRVWLYELHTNKTKKSNGVLASK